MGLLTIAFTLSAAAVAVDPALQMVSFVQWRASPRNKPHAMQQSLPLVVERAEAANALNATFVGGDTDRGLAPSATPFRVQPGHSLLDKVDSIAQRLNIKVGDRVRVRDSEKEEWQLASVTSVDPLEAAPDYWEKSFEWSMLEKVETTESYVHSEGNTSTILTPDDGRDYVEWDFKNAQVHSNLGGLGPHGGEQALRYVGVANVSGVVVDLVITATTPYKCNNIAMNGLSGDFGVINVKSSKKSTESVTLLFNFYQSQTNKSVAFNHFYFTIYDVDESNTAVESVTFYNRVDKVYRVPNCELEQSGSLESGLTFTSTRFGDGSDNPSDPDALTEVQKERAVTVDFTNKSWWRATFSVTGGKAGRNFLFAGHASTIPTQAPTPAPTPSPTIPRKATTTTTTIRGSEKCFGDCIVWGDPHIISFDLHQKHLLQHPHREALFRTRAWKMDQVTIQEEGLFWLVKSSDVHIQGIFSKNRTHPQFTNLAALGIGGPFLGTNVLVFRPLVDKVTWNDVEILSSYPSSFGNEYVTATYHNASEIVMNGHTGAGIDVTFPKGVTLTVNRWKQNLAVRIKMCTEEAQDGLCGNLNGSPKNDIPDKLKAPYILSNENSNECPDGYSHIAGGQCETAAAALGGTFVSTNDHQYRPAGCYWRMTDSRVYANTHSVGSAYAGTQVVCGKVSPVPTPTAAVTNTADHAVGNSAIKEELVWQKKIFDSRVNHMIEFVQNDPAMPPATMQSVVSKTKVAQGWQKEDLSVDQIKSHIQEIDYFMEWVVNQS